MNYILIVWEMNPEELNLYLIPSNKLLEQFSLDNLKTIHNKLLNSTLTNEDEEEIINDLSEFLTECTKYKKEKAIQLEKNEFIELVIHTGWIL